MVFWAIARASSRFRFGRGFRFLSSEESKTSWDPTKSLELNHRSLVLLEECRSRNHFKEILGQVMRAGLVGKTFPMSRLIYFSAISYPENSDMASLLFDHFVFYPNLFVFNTMISSIAFPKIQSFSLYNSMLYHGLSPDKHTLVYLLKKSRFVSEVKQIHCHAVVRGLFSYGYLKNSLINLYLEKGSREIARRVFDQMWERSIVSYNIMIVGNAKEGSCYEAIKLFREMLSSGLEPDEYTILGLLVCCGELREARLGKSVHSWMKRREFSESPNMILRNALVDMYVKCKEFDSAKKGFDLLSEKDTFSWNTLVSGYVKSGNLELALTHFEKIPKKDIVSWNSIISGFSRKADYNKAVNLFNAMTALNVRPDNVTMLSLISAAEETRTLDLGKPIHGLIVRNRIEVDAFLGSALIDMYSKCGSIELAFSLFKWIEKKDVAVWTTMISGFAFNGLAKEALDLFLEMQKTQKPNRVTFIAILSACTHGGLVEEGLEVFHGMKKRFDIEPGIEHYGCLVDLLGRSGRLSEAKEVIEKMPMKPSRSVWGAMLSACRAFGNTELAERASTELLELEPEREGGYVLLSNIYAANQNWNDSDFVRGVMERRGLKKTVGFSRNRSYS